MKQTYTLQRSEVPLCKAAVDNLGQWIERDGYTLKATGNLPDNGFYNVAAYRPGSHPQGECDFYVFVDRDGEQVSIDPEQPSDAEVTLKQIRDILWPPDTDDPDQFSWTPDTLEAIANLFTDVPPKPEREKTISIELAHDVLTRRYTTFTFLPSAFRAYLTDQKIDCIHVGIDNVDGETVDAFEAGRPLAVSSTHTDNDPDEDVADPDVQLMDVIIGD